MSLISESASYKKLFLLVLSIYGIELSKEGKMKKSWHKLY